MQYGSYFPQSYQNMYSQQYQQNGFGNQQMPTSTMQAQNPAQIGNFSQQSGFIPVQNENEARMYPLAPGTSATFIDENAPYCYTKTLGASQLDRPTFKRFRLVEEIDSAQDAPQGSQSRVSNQSIDLSKYALQADLDAFSERLDALQTQLDSMTAKRQTAKSKKEDDGA
jgi:hypothetical protein